MSIGTCCQLDVAVDELFQVHAWTNSIVMK